MSEAPVRFKTDRAVYFESHLKLAALAMGGAMLVLWLAGNPNVWIGAAAGLGAIALRGWYLRAQDLSAVWELRDGLLTGPGGRRVPLDQIETLRRIGSFVQVVTRSGDRYLIKYQADPAATIAALRRAQNTRPKDTTA